MVADPLGFATSTMESFRKATPVAPDPEVNATVRSSMASFRSTTASAGTNPKGTAARAPRTAIVTGLPSAPSPTVRACSGSSTSKIVTLTSVLASTTPTPAVSVGNGSVVSLEHAPSSTITADRSPTDPAARV